MTDPQCAYAALTHGVMAKWNYVFRTTPNIIKSLQPLEDFLRTQFIPTLLSRDAPNDTERELFSLPCRLGGHGITSPLSYYEHQFGSSVA